MHAKRICEGYNAQKYKSRLMNKNKLIWVMIMKTTKISKRFWQVVIISNVDDASSFLIDEPNPCKP
jgi:hypothetical protein